MAFLKALLFASFVSAIVAQNVLEQEAPAKYSFQYNVADPTTGDQKEQQEERDGDNVRGFYSLVESDGTLRRVDYTADAEHGFQAVVTKQAGAAHPIPVARALVSQPAVHHVVSQPAIQVVSQPRYVSSPVAYHAPTTVVQSSPVATYHAPLAYHAPTTVVQSSPVYQTYHAPAAYQTYHAPAVSSQIVQHAPVVSSVPQYITRVSSPRIVAV